MSKVLLLEPNYKNKYPPMGLMKLATYYRERGDDVRFFKGDLRDLAATLLCEKYLLKVKDCELAEHTPKLLEHIKTGKYEPIDAIAGFQDSENYQLLKTYRKKFINKDYKFFDIICATTLFTFYLNETINTINTAKNFLKKNGKLMIGGIASTILPDYIFEQTEIRPQCGLLNKPGTLDEDDINIIDELPLDYSILEEIDYKYPASNAYFAYMTRGCPNKCPFCAVPRLEPKYCGYIKLKPQLEKADTIFGKQKDLLLMDNNVFASDKFSEIITEIKECGFGRGAKYTPTSEYEIAFGNICAKNNERAYKKKMMNIYDDITDKLLTEEEKGSFYIARKKAELLHAIYAKTSEIKKFDKIARPLYEKFFKQSERTRYIDFNQGVDARFVTDEKMKKLSEINIRPLRIAFDRYTPKMIEQYRSAVELASKYKITNLSNYLLYNYDDKPEDLYERMKMNVELCEELNVTIYSFPMKYHPIDDPDFFYNRDYIGKHWNRKFIRAIQAVLNATKGKIGKGKTFFEEAFGRNVEEFQKILWMPEAFIIYRRRYDENLRNRLAERYTNHYEDESDLANEWWERFSSLDENSLNKVKEIVGRNRFDDEDYETEDALIAEVLEYYKVTRKS